MDRAKAGLLLAVTGSFLLVAAAGLDLVAGDRRFVQGQGVLTGGGSQPWLVAFVPVPAGDEARLVGSMTAGPDEPINWWLVEADDAQAVLDGRPASSYASGMGGLMHAGFVRDETPDASSMGVAVVWKTTRPLSANEMVAFDMAADAEHCCVRGVTGDYHEATAGTAFVVGVLGFVAMVAGIVLWWRRGAGRVDRSEPSDFVALFGRSRAYIAQLGQFATLALVLIAIVALMGLVQLLQEFHGFGNAFEGFLFGNTRLFGFVFALAFPFAWMLRLRSTTRRESARLAALDAESPL